MQNPAKNTLSSTRERLVEQGCSPKQTSNMFTYSERVGSLQGQKRAWKAKSALKDGGVRGGCGSCSWRYEITVRPSAVKPKDRQPRGAAQLTALQVRHRSLPVF